MSTACKTGCSGACHQGRAQCEHQPREAASAATEVGANQPRVRMGSVGRRQCWLIKNGSTVALVVALVGAVVWGWAR